MAQTTCCSKFPCWTSSSRMCVLESGSGLCTKGRVRAGAFVSASVILKEVSHSHLYMDRNAISRKVDSVVEMLKRRMHGDRITSLGSGCAIFSLASAYNINNP